MEKVFSRSCSTNSRSFSKLDAGNFVSFKIKVFGGKINGTTLAMHLIKMTACSSFMLLGIIRQTNRVHQRFSSVVFSFPISFSLYISRATSSLKFSQIYIALLNFNNILSRNTWWLFLLVHSCVLNIFLRYVVLRSDLLRWTIDH